MAQIDDSAFPNNRVLHERIDSSLVRLVCYKQVGTRKRRIIHIITGITIVACNGFSHIIALWKNVKDDEERDTRRYEVTLPDGTKQQLRLQDVQVHGILALFTLRTASEVNPVEFSRQEASRNEVVFTAGFNVATSMSSHLSEGLVTNARPGYVSHNCPPFKFTPDGEPLFNKEGHLVGISFKDLGITIALNVGFLTKFLSLCYKGMKNKPLGVILQHIEDQSEHAKRKKRKKV